jgi:hypothetical protein
MAYGDIQRYVETLTASGPYIHEIVHRRIYKWLNDDGTINKEFM